MNGSFVQTVICSHICWCFLRIWLILYIKRILTNFLWPYRWQNQLEPPNITWPQSLLMFAPTTSFLDLKIMNMNIGRRKFPLISNIWNISSSQRMIKYVRKICPRYLPSIELCKKKYLPKKYVDVRGRIKVISHNNSVTMENCKFRSQGWCSWSLRTTTESITDICIW